MSSDGRTFGRIDAQAFSALAPAGAAAPYGLDGKRGAMIHSMPDPDGERVVSDLLAYMTTEEKAGQLTIVSAPDPQDRAEVERFTQALRSGRVTAVEGIGSKIQAEAFQQIAIEESRLGIPLLFPMETGTGIETIFPAPLAAAASWDMDAISNAEAVIAREAHALGCNWALAPDAGDLPSAMHAEDGHESQVDLVAALAAARVRGLQGLGDPSHEGVLACLDLSPIIGKAAAGRAQGKEIAEAMRVAAKVAEQGYLGSISVGGGTVQQRREARKAFSFLEAAGAFDGIILSEWKALAAAARDSEPIESGDSMPVDALVAAVEKGKIPLARLDDAVTRVLRAKYALGLFTLPLGKEAVRSRGSLPTPIQNRETALTLAKRSIVLLRNEPAMLPLGFDSGDLLVIGAPASDRRAPLAGRTGHAASLIDGLEQLGVPHKFAPGLALRHDNDGIGRMIEADSMAIGMACEAAKRARTVIVTLGPREGSELAEAERQLLASLRTVTDRIVLVTLGAAPLDPIIGSEPLACVLHAGQLGTMSGHAIAEILTGEAAPTGKLPVEMKASAQSHGLPFGHGLHYADFALTDFTLDLASDRVVASVSIRNLAEVAGVETVQLYLRRYRGNHLPSRLHLRGFQRISLAPGERRSVTFEIGREEIGQHREDGRYFAEGGRYDVRIGLSSKRVLGGEIEVPDAIARAMTSSFGHGQASFAGRRRA